MSRPRAYRSGVMAGGVGLSLFQMARANFHDPSGCRRMTQIDFPESVTPSPPSFGVTVYTSTMQQRNGRYLDGG